VEAAAAADTTTRWYVSSYNFGMGKSPHKNSRKRVSREHHEVVMQFECGTRILRVIHGRDARATFGKLHHYRDPNLLSAG